AEVTRLRLRDVLRIGNRSLMIGLAFLAAALAAGNFVGRHVDGQFGDLLKESLVIGGWVAMWKPLETFLYDWWPIEGEVRLLRRLAAMPGRIEYRAGAAPHGRGVAGGPGRAPARAAGAAAAAARPAALIGGT